MIPIPLAFLAACSVLLLSTSTGLAGDDLKIENRHGFKTGMPGEQFRAYWESLKDSHKMRGKLSDHLTKEGIDSLIMLEVNITIAVDPRSPSLQDELLRFMTEGNRFETGRLPDSFDKSPRKHLAAIFRTKGGHYGLITLYRELAVIDLNGLVGIAPATVENINQPAADTKKAIDTYTLVIMRGGGLPPPNAPHAEFEHYSFTVAMDGGWEFRSGIFGKRGFKKGKLNADELQRWIKDIEDRGFHKLKSNPNLGGADESFIDITIRSRGEKTQKRIGIEENLFKAVTKKVIELTKTAE